MILRDYPDCSVALLGGFDPVDDIPVTRVCDHDDYDSCHDKVWAVLERNTGDEADWFVIADDDTWFNLLNLAATLTLQDNAEAIICGLVSPTVMADGAKIPHAHGGCGIVVSSAALKLLRSVPRPWPRHSKHSDISLAMLANLVGIQWCHIENMLGPDEPVDLTGLRNAVSVHVKDRASFAQLYKALTEDK